MTLLERYKEMHEKGTEAYFDADEIIRLLEYFEDENDFEGFTQVRERAPTGTRNGCFDA